MTTPQTPCTWKVTDPSTNQMMMKLSEFKFRFKEDGRKEVEIDLSKYNIRDVEECINSYGYSLFYSVTKKQMEASVIAECIFEMEIKP